MSLHSLVCPPGSRLRPKTLQAVDVPVIDNRLCEKWHQSNGINVIIYDEMMCAGYRGGGKDSCQVRVRGISTGARRKEILASGLGRLRIHDINIRDCIEYDENHRVSR